MNNMGVMQCSNRRRAAISGAIIALGLLAAGGNAVGHYLGRAGPVFFDPAPNRLIVKVRENIHMDRPRWSMRTDLR